MYKGGSAEAAFGTMGTECITVITMVVMVVVVFGGGSDSGSVVVVPFPLPTSLFSSFISSTSGWLTTPPLPY
jgi:hypothetical protein